MAKETEKYKQKAIDLISRGLSDRAVAKALGGNVGYSTVWRWRKSLREQ